MQLPSHAKKLSSIILFISFGMMPVHLILDIMCETVPSHRSYASAPLHFFFCNAKYVGKFATM
jgi:hypothetical protein